MALTTAALNEAADGVTIDEIHLHSGPPGANGTDNLIADTETPITLGAAIGGERSLAGGAVSIPVPAGTVSHYSLWGGSTLKSARAFAAPEEFASPGSADISSVTFSAVDDSA